MPDMELRIGIENEMYLEVDGQYPPEFKDKRDFEALGDYLVPFYTQQGGEALLRKDFSHAAHPGHYDDHNESGQWTITTDYGIGEVTLNDPPDLKRCPSSYTVHGIFIIRS